MRSTPPHLPGFFFYSESTFTNLANSESESFTGSVLETNTVQYTCQSWSNLQTYALTVWKPTAMTVTGSKFIRTAPDLKRQKRRTILSMCCRWFELLARFQLGVLDSRVRGFRSVSAQPIYFTAFSR